MTALNKGKGSRDERGTHGGGKKEAKVKVM
jgi:hypothetical protein